MTYPLTLSPFTRAALASLLWSETDEDGRPLLDDAPGTDYEDTDYIPVEDYTFDSAGLAELDGECRAFLAELEEAGLLDLLDEQSHAFNWILTRNAHGAGYWDLGLGEDGETLSRMSRTYGTVGLHRADDGTLYFHG